MLLTTSSELPPDSPASISATSPGARCTSTNVATMTARISGIAWRARRPMYATGTERPPRLLRDLRPVDPVVGIQEAEHAGGEAGEVLVGERRELDLVDPHDGKIGDEDLLHARVLPLALVDVLLGLGLGEEAVDLGVGVAGHVAVGDALLDVARQIRAVEADDRVRVVREEVGGDVELPVRHAAHVGREVGTRAHDHVDPDSAELLLH